MTIRLNTDVVLDGDLTIGDVRLQSQAGTVNALLLNGQILSAHDAEYAFVPEMHSNGTLLGEEGQDVGFPRWSLADAATQRVKWAWAIPAEWDQVAVRFGWNSEIVPAGGAVVWQYSYKLFYPFAGDNVDTAAVTTVALGAIAAPNQHVFQYQIPTAIQTINTPDGAFGSKPFLISSLARLGADAADTLAGAASVTLATLTRTI